MTTGYIYVLKNEVGGMGGYKIGKTIDPTRRFRELKLGTKASLVGLWSSDNYSAIEKRLHRMLDHLRVPQSEWFALNAETLEDLQNRLNLCASNVNDPPEEKPHRLSSVVYLPPSTTGAYSGSSSYDFDCSQPVVRPSTKPSETPNAIGGFIGGFTLGWIFFIGWWLWIPIAFSETFRKNMQNNNPGLIPGLTVSTVAFLIVAFSNS